MPAMLTSLSLLLLLALSAIALPAPARRWALTVPRSVRSTHIKTRNAHPTIPAWSYTPIIHTNKTLSSTAAAAIKVLLTHRDSKNTFTDLDWWQAANAYSAILAYNQTLYTPLVTAAISTMELANEFNDDTLWWANVCFESGLTEAAEGLWRWVRATSQIKKTGVAPEMGGIKRESALSAHCELKDGVYWTTRPNEVYVNSITTALLMQVSARLAERGGNKFLHAAEGAGKWLRKHMLDESVALVGKDGVEGDTCDFHEGAFTYNTGVWIGALTSMYKATKDRSYLKEAEEAAASAMETKLWTDGNGMITEVKGETSNNDRIGFRSILIRNLMELYKTTESPPMKQEIRGFVNVNYNSLYEKARSGDNWDVNWFGPFTKATPWGQLAAVDLLVAGMVVNDDEVNAS